MKINPLVMQGVYLIRNEKGNFVKDHYFRFNFYDEKKNKTSLMTTKKLKVGNIIMNSDKKYEIIYIKSESKIINDYLIQEYIEVLND